MNNFETFFYYFGLIVFCLSTIGLILYIFIFNKKKYNQFRFFLMNSIYFHPWCVVCKWKGFQNETKYFYLTYFFAKWNLNKAKRFVQITHPLKNGNVCHSFMYKVHSNVLIVPKSKYA